MPLFFRSPQSMSRSKKKSDDNVIANSSYSNNDTSVEEGNPLLPQNASSVQRRKASKPLLLPMANVTGSGGNNNNNNHHVFTNSNTSNFAMPTPSCHSFLLGGQYYPGKDKRYKRKQQSALYRTCKFVFIFTSVAVVSVCSFVLVQQSIILYNAHRYHHDILTTWRASNNNAVYSLERWYQHYWPAVQRARNEMSTVEIQGDLERIAHGWWHRNDAPHTLIPKHKKDSLAKVNNDNKSDNTKKTNNDNNIDNQKDVNKNINANNRKLPEIKQSGNSNSNNIGKHIIESPLTLNVHATSHTPLWTIQSMDSTHKPSCPSVATTTITTTTAEQQLQITLVTQTTPDRLPLLQRTCQHWSDPIVVVVALDDDDHDFVQPEWWNEMCSHAYMITLVRPVDPQDYPVNYYRNVGLEAVSTSHVIVLDVDLIPSSNLTEILHTLLKKQQQIQDHASTQTISTPTALVVPAWERFIDEPCAKNESCLQNLRNDASFLPSDIFTLQDCVKNKHCRIFQESDNWEGHFTTHSYEWLLQTGTIDTTKDIHCFDSLRYEPYVVLPWCQQQHHHSSVHLHSNAILPYYDERFVGYGKNKIEYIQHLRFLGYRFAIVPQGFVIHFPHAESAVKQKWNAKNQNDLHQRMDALYLQFLQQVVQKYPPIAERPIIENCKRQSKQTER